MYKRQDFRQRIPIEEGSIIRFPFFFSYETRGIYNLATGSKLSKIDTYKISNNIFYNVDFGSITKIDLETGTVWKYYSDKLLLSLIHIFLLVFLLMGITYLHAYIKRPEQMQSLQLYEQKLETISSKKVNEEYYVSGRASQNNNLEITYDFVTIDDVKEILSKQNIGWNEISKNRIVGHDYEDVYKRQILYRGDKYILNRGS